ncbi:MAG: BON domain-containing protein [Betaproteobacteria bacterium]
MKIKKILTYFAFNLILLSITLSMQGCFPLLAGGMVSGVMVAADRRPLAVTTIDRGLQIQIEADLTKNYGDNLHVNVNVFNQKVLLTGEAKTIEIKNQIDSYVRKQSNVKTLANELQVGIPSSVSSRLTDTSTYSLIKARLVATTDVPSNSMKIVVEAGRVYLLGIATDTEAKAAAVVTSKSSNGIKEVNKLFDIISEDEKKRLDGVTK